MKAAANTPWRLKFEESGPKVSIVSVSCQLPAYKEDRCPWADEVRRCNAAKSVFQ
jgi:hypothetical protein